MVWQWVELYIKLENITNSEIVLRKAAAKLLDELYRPNVWYRSVGIELRKISYNGNIQDSLFDCIKQDDDKLSRILDELEQKFGQDIIKLGI